MSFNQYDHFTRRCDSLAESLCGDHPRKQCASHVLDSDIGDGDHGANMNRGMQSVLTEPAGCADKDIGTMFKTIGYDPYLYGRRRKRSALWHDVYANGQRDGRQNGTHTRRLDRRRAGGVRWGGDARQGAAGGQDHGGCAQLPGLNALKAERDRGASTCPMR